MYDNIHAIAYNVNSSVGILVLMDDGGLKFIPQ